MANDDRTAGAGRLGSPQGERLHELLSLAQAYRGWSLKELAQHLGRDPHNIVPSSGIPKLDLVLRLAEALDWPVGDVVSDLCYVGAHPDVSGQDDADFVALDRAAYKAYEEGRHQDLVALGRRAYLAAKTPDERARACMRECGGWDGMGHFNLVREVVARGLRELDIKPSMAMTLRGNLANAYYSLGQLAEAEGISTANLALLDAAPELDAEWPGARAFANYVRGNCFRAYALERSQLARLFAERARSDLDAARVLYESISARTGSAAYSGIANTCVGGILVTDALLERRSVDEVLDTMLSSLDRVIEVERAPSGDWLESHGWWCIFACQLAARLVNDRERLERLLAVFTNKVHDIANHLGNWTLRERVFSLEHFRQKVANPEAGRSYVLDSEDLQILTGAMGRFPAFRERGWELLRTRSIKKDGSS